MKPGKDWLSGKAQNRARQRGRGTLRFLAAHLTGMVVCFLAAGCAHKAQHRADVGKNLMNDRELTTRRQGVAEHYQIGCPDVLAIVVNGNPIWATRQAVGADGRIDLGERGRVRVEGRTSAEIVVQIAHELDVPRGAVQVRVAEYRSQQLFLFGQVVGCQRSVPYRGQETVLDLLQRVGGITPGAEPGEVYVVRAHVAEGGRPEVFHVDLQAVVGGHDEKTNLRLMPNDQVYVGETRQARIERAIPPWFLPIYQAFWNTRASN